MKKPILTVLLSLASMNLFAACDDPAAAGVDWSGCDKSGQYLWHTNLANANLSGANFSGANLSVATLSGANLSYATLSNADLSGANLSDADLSHTSLNDAILLDAQLGDANLRQSNLGNTNLSYSYMKGADLRYASLRTAFLGGAYMREANLSFAHLDHANLSNTDLSDAIGMPDSITSALWFNTACPDLTNSNSNGNTCAGHFLEEGISSRPPEPSVIPTLSFWNLGLLSMFMLLLGFRFSQRT